MRKDILAHTFAVTLTLCLSTFLTTDGTAEDAMKPSMAQSNSSLTVAMYGTPMSPTAQSVPAPGASTDGMDENYLILVQRGEEGTKPTDEHIDDANKKPCKDAQCPFRAPRAGGLDKAVDGTACTSGVVCSFPNSACMSNTGKCKTVHVGGGQCACPCVPN
jgi:hypothetical protein